MEKKGISEREALQRIIDVLDPLQSEARSRVLRTVATFFDMPGSRLETEGTVTLGDGPAQRGPSFSGHQVLSPKQFLLDKHPRTEVDRVACLAYYLSHYLETPHFKTADITRMNTEAAQRKFSNAAYAVNNAAQSGYLTAASKGTKQITALGEQYVEALPDTEAAKEVLQRLRPRRPRKKTPSKSPKRQTSSDTDGAIS